MRRLRDEGASYALAVVDLDHFKLLNDTYGHDTGDRALRTFARVLSEVVRTDDLACRYGGEEFVIVLRGSDVVSAAPVLHRLRTALDAAVGTAHVPSFTVSIGLADSSWSNDMTDVFRAADAAMFEAKHLGRDRLVIADTPSTAGRKRFWPGLHAPGCAKSGPERLTTAASYIRRAARSSRSR